MKIALCQPHNAVCNAGLIASVPSAGRTVFAMNAHRFETPDAAAERLIRGKPALAIWGEADHTLRPEHFLPLFSAIFPAAPIVCQMSIITASKTHPKSSLARSPIHQSDLTRSSDR